ncbi:MAG: type II secretion system protein [Spirochaetota bacterium]
MRTSASGITNRLSRQDGFSLVELITAITLISVLSVVVAPRIANYFGGQRKNLSFLTAVITKTFDDAFVNNRTNLLAIHLAYPDAEGMAEENSTILERTNGYSVITISGDGTMVESDRPVLKSRTFPGSFLIERVISSNGVSDDSGTILVPFYPEGYSSDTIIHVSADNHRQYSIIISKLKKEPYVRDGHVDFETMWEDGAF